MILKGRLKNLEDVGGRLLEGHEIIACMNICFEDRTEQFCNLVKYFQSWNFTSSIYGIMYKQYWSIMVLLTYNIELSRNQNVY